MAAHSLMGPGAMNHLQHHWISMIHKTNFSNEHACSKHAERNEQPKEGSEHLFSAIKHTIKKTQSRSEPPAGQVGM
jgi:hypothetical protein